MYSATSALEIQAGQLGFEKVGWGKGGGEGIRFNL